MRTPPSPRAVAIIALYIAACSNPLISEPIVLPASEGSSEQITPGGPTTNGLTVLDGEGELLLRVSGRDGLPLPDVGVTAAGISLGTGNSGDLRLSRLPVTGDDQVLRFQREGYAPVVRRAPLTAGDATRIEVEMTPLRELGHLSANQDNWITEGGFELFLPANSLNDLGGTQYAGEFVVRLAAYETHDSQPLSAARIPAPMLGEWHDSTEELTSFGMLYVELLDSQGYPLQLAPNKSATVIRTLSGDIESLGLSEGLEVWSLDEVQGMWRPHEQAVAVQQTEGDSGDTLTTLTAEIPHFSWVNFDLRGGTGCARVELDVTDNLLRGGRLSVQGLGKSYEEATSSKVIDIIGVPKKTSGAASELTVTWTLYDTKVSSRVAKIGTINAKGACTASPTLLRIPGVGTSTPKASNGTLLVRTRSGDCPLTGGTVTLTDAAGRRVAQQLGNQPLVWFRNLTKGDYTLTLRHGKKVLDTTVVSITGGGEPTLATLKTEDVQGLTVTSPPGGCIPLPCEGDECSTCLDMSLHAGDTALDQTSLDLSGQSFETDEQGEVCVDIPDQAGELVQVAWDGTVLAETRLAEGGACSAPETCRSLALQVNAGSVCPSDTVAQSVSASLYGPLDPGYLGASTLNAPVPVEGGQAFLRLITEGDRADAHPLDAGCDGLCALEADVWGWEPLQQDARGRSRSAGLNLRIALRSGGALTSQGLRLNLSRPLSSWTVGSKVDAVGLISAAELVGGVSGDDGYTLPYSAKGGQIVLNSTDSGMLRFELLGLELQSEAGAALNEHLTLDGVLSASFLQRGQMPQGLEMLEDRPLAGVSVSVGAWGGTASERLYGISEPSAGGLSLCVPESSPFELYGPAPTGAMPTRSPLLTRGSEGLSPYGWNKPTGRAMVSSTHRWVERDLVERLYQQAGRPSSEVDTRATVIGLAMRCDKQGCQPLSEPWIDVIPPNKLCEGEQIVMVPETPGRFAVLGIDDRCSGAPYVLSIREARTGPEVVQLLFIPKAGTITVLGGDTPRYLDRDLDGCGSNIVVPKGLGTGVYNHSDCDDKEPLRYPGALEVCDDLDNDCDGLTDTDDPDLDWSGTLTLYADTDEDGYGDINVDTSSCDDSADGWVSNSADCDDVDERVSPDADELCDGFDNNCDGQTDEDGAADATIWYADGDGDGYGTLADSTYSCTQPAGYSPYSDDCDDEDAAICPIALEFCDGQDNDCDGDTDEPDAVDAMDWYADIDGDGYGDSSATLRECVEPTGYVLDSTDCQPSNSYSFPGAVEICGDGVVSECDIDAARSACGLWGSISLEDADYILMGEQKGDHAGDVVSSAGDVNGDGYDDILIGAHYAENNRVSQGATYLVLGPVTSSTQEFSLSNAHAIYYGEHERDEASWNASSAGDINNDGLDDLLIGARYEDTKGSSAGVVYVITSVTTGEQTLDTAQARLYGENADDKAGRFTKGAGDVDADGWDDIVVGAPSSEALDEVGKAYILWGNMVTGDLDLQNSPVILHGESVGDCAGNTVTGVGDTDGDGLDDVLIGAPGADISDTDAGAVYLVQAPSTGTMSLGSANLTLTGLRSGDHAGDSIAAAGDTNGDGVPDLLIGAPGQNVGMLDSAYLVTTIGSGVQSLAIADVSFVPAPDSSNLGISVSSAGDVDGDGFMDILIGASASSPTSLTDSTVTLSNAGITYLLYGPLSGSVDLSHADVRILGNASGDYAGYYVSGAGDTDGDGLDDILIGAWGVDGVGKDSGAAYLLLGKSL